VRSNFTSSSFCRRSRSNSASGNTASLASSFTSDKRGSANSESPAKEIALVSAPALEDRSAPMRRKSSSIWRLARFAVPVRTTEAVISASPGARSATAAFPDRKKSSP